MSDDSTRPPLMEGRALFRNDHWRNRRIALLGSSVFYGGVISYALVLGDPTNSLHIASSSSSFLALAVNVMSYVFGPIYEDLTMAKSGFVHSLSHFAKPETK